jgi:hypothetical protein
MNMGAVSIFWCLHQLLSSVFHSLNYRDLSPTWLGLFLDMFSGYCAWDCFPVSFHSTLDIGIQRSYWFLYPATLQKVFSRLKSCLVESLESLKYRVIASANSGNLSYSFPIPLISFSCLLSLAKHSSTVLSQSGKSGHSCLRPHFRGSALSCSPFSVIAAVQFVTRGLCYIAVLFFYC